MVLSDKHMKGTDPMIRRVMASAMLVGALGLTTTAFLAGGASAARGHAAAAPTVSLRKTPLGTILVSSKGLTLYLWLKDKGGKSVCFGACATVWPPLTVSGKPTAGPGVSAAKLTTVARPGGVKQVVYNGHPLYLYQADTAPGSTTGQGSPSFGAPWYVLAASGNAITKR